MTHIPESSGDTGGAEAMTTGRLHWLPQGQKTDGTLQSLVESGVKLGIISFHG